METWEVDPSEVSLDDIIMLERMESGSTSASEIKTFLGRLVSNKTEDEIGQICLPDLCEHIG